MKLSKRIEKLDQEMGDLESGLLWLGYRNEFASKLLRRRYRRLKQLKSRLIDRGY